MWLSFTDEAVRGDCGKLKPISCTLKCAKELLSNRGPSDCRKLTQTGRKMNGSSQFSKRLGGCLA